jgi:hypothetical protein
MAILASQSLLRIIPRTTYNLSELIRGTIGVPVAQHIDVLGYSRAALQVRVYRGTIPNGASVTVQLADDGFDPSEPGPTLLRTTTTDGKDIGSVKLDEGTAFPFYQSILVEVPAAISRMAAVVLSFVGGAEAGPLIEVGLDLVLTGGAVGSTVSQPSTYLGYASEPVERLESFSPIGDGESQVGTSPPTTDEDFLTRVAQAVRSVLGASGDAVAKLPPGYPRFGNVNVAIARPVEQVRSPELVDVVRALILRGGLDLTMPDGGYARFGNVNVGIGRQPIDEPGGTSD